jgi:hypothetical protein
MAPQKEMEPVAAEVLKMAPAVAAIRQFTDRYGLTLTADASRQVMDKALEHKTESAVRNSVRAQLFHMLTETNPGKAIEIEINRYERKGFEISEKTKNETMLETRKIFESPEQARQAYLGASRMIRKEVAEQSHGEPAQVAQTKAAQVAQAPKAEEGERKERAGASQPAPTQQTPSPEQVATIAKKLEEMAGERLGLIYAQNFNQKTIVNYCKAMPCPDSEKLEILDGALDLIKKHAASPDNIGFIYISALQNGNATPEMKVAMDLQQKVLATNGDIKLTTEALVSFSKDIKPAADLIVGTRELLHRRGIGV